MNPSCWRTRLRKNFTRWDDLARFLLWENVPPAYVSPQFPLNLPLRIAEKIEKNNLDDPLLKQFLPSCQEASLIGMSDPVGDCAAQKTQKLLHKYHGRALLLASSACAMHCRYCFRKHYAYETQKKDFENELALIAQDPSLSEIILSGGDPLSLSNEHLSALISALSAIPHLKRIRFHTRFPMGIPERIDPAFLDILQQCRPQVFFVIHSNHPREWDDEIRTALRSIRKLGIPVLCQTVLLKGVNDAEETLVALCEELVNQGIIPYYLHQLDEVAGGMHFAVDTTTGHHLVRALAARLPGYGIPQYVQEIAGAPSKLPVTQPLL